MSMFLTPASPTASITAFTKAAGPPTAAHSLAAMAKALGWCADRYDPGDFTPASVGKRCADERSMVVVATQGQADEDMVERAVAMRPAYLGLVASRKRAEAVLGYLAERGVPKDQLDRVHAPAGLDLGKTTHEEVAVAILAQLVQLRASGFLADIPTQGPELRPGHRAELKLAGAAADAADPVCGMTVRAAASAMPLEHGGVTYYFCCAGCRRSFEANPYAYTRVVLP